MSAEGDAPVAARSQGLELFRLNAFRVLRVPVTAATDRAVWAADKALNLLRAGMPRTGADALPWLAEPDEIEIQDAARRVEEPVEHLVERLTWFDFEADGGDVVRAALASLDPARVAEALALKLRPAPDGADGDALVAAFGARLNLCNLRLALAFAALHGRLGAAAPAPVGLGAWAQRGGLEVIRDAHAGVAGADGASADAAARLEEALVMWFHALGEPSFARYAAALAASLDDERVSADDAEAVERAVRARLTDVVAGEARDLLLAGHADRAAAVVRVAAKSSADAAQWRAAFKPLRAVFQAEVDELDRLVGDGSDVAAVGRYVSRVGALSRRWKSLDAEGALGLEQVVDAALTRALRRLLAIHASVPNEGFARTSREVAAVLERLGPVASAPSLRHRVQEVRERLELDAKFLCHFCLARPPGEHAVGLSATRETHREYVGGNTWRVYSETLRQVVPRCDACADAHDWVFTRAWWFGGAASISAVLWWMLLGDDAAAAGNPYATHTGGAGFWAGCLALAAVVGLFFASRRVLALLTVGSGHRPYWELDTSEGMHQMNTRGFSWVNRDYKRGVLQRFRGS